jgi:hypothetical protein
MPVQVAAFHLQIKPVRQMRQLGCGHPKILLHFEVN